MQLHILYSEEICKNCLILAHISAMHVEIKKHFFVLYFVYLDFELLKYQKINDRWLTFQNLFHMGRCGAIKLNLFRK